MIFQTIRGGATKTFLRELLHLYVMMDSCHAESVYWTTLRDMNYCAYHIDVETGFRQLESDKKECDQRLWNYMEREVEIKMQR